MGCGRDRAGNGEGDGHAQRRQPGTARRQVLPVGIRQYFNIFVGGILSEQEYVALSWLLVSINAFNRITIAGKYPVPPRRGERAASAPS